MTIRQDKTQSPPELLEPGDAFARLSGAPLSNGRSREHYEVVVIGAGQAGLSVGYHLKKRGIRCLILDGSERIGDVWRQRWDTLRLFTPARFDGLDGYPFPANPDYFPTKDEMADYLESYAAKFQLPVRLRTRVERLSKIGDRYLLATRDGTIEADQVIVAMASYQRQQVPAFAAALGSDVTQIKSSKYKSSAQLSHGSVLIAGAGNSGAEIAMDIRRTSPDPERSITVSGRATGEVPFRHSGFWTLKLFLPLLLRIVFHRVLTIRTPFGRKARPKMISQGGPLIRVKQAELDAAGVHRAPRVVGVCDGKPQLMDGQVLDIKNVVWCTGFTSGFDWIELPIFDERGEPFHDGGVVHEYPGLYFVGLHFLFSFSSTMIHGVGRDAERIARHVDAYARRHVPALSVAQAAE